MPTKKPDDEVGEAKAVDGGRLTPEQAAVLGGGGEVGGRPEPKTGADWSALGASGGEPGRPPVALGGNSQGQGDRMPTGGGTRTDAPATNPKTKPGHEHDA